MCTCSPVAGQTWMQAHTPAQVSGLPRPNPVSRLKACSPTLAPRQEVLGRLHLGQPYIQQRMQGPLRVSAACRYSTPNRRRRAQAKGAASAPPAARSASSADTGGTTGAGLAAASLSVGDLPDLAANPYGGATAVQDLLGLEVIAMPGGATELAARCWRSAGGLPQMGAGEGQRVVWPDSARPGSAQLLHKVGACLMCPCLSALMQLEGASSVPAVVMSLLLTAQHGTAFACTGPTVVLLWWLFSQAAHSWTLVCRRKPRNLCFRRPHSPCSCSTMQGDGRLPILHSPILEPVEVMNPWLEEIGLGGSASAGADAGMGGRCSSQLTGEPLGLDLATLPQPFLCLAGGYGSTPLQLGNSAGWPDLATRLLQDNEELRVRGHWGAAEGACCPEVPEPSEAGQRRETSLFPAVALAVDAPMSAALAGLLEGNAALREAWMAQGGPGGPP